MASFTPIRRMPLNYRHGPRAKGRVQGGVPVLPEGAAGISIVMVLIVRGLIVISRRTSVRRGQRLQVA